MGTSETDEAVIVVADRDRIAVVIVGMAALSVRQQLYVDLMTQQWRSVNSYLRDGSFHMSTQIPKTGKEADFLREFATFERFATRELQKLVRAADRVTLPANWPLIHEQTPGDACYILLSGSVAVYSGRERVAELGPGDVAGDVALRQGRLRSATVSTLEPVEMLRIEGADLHRLLDELPALRSALESFAADHGGEPASS